VKSVEFKNVYMKYEGAGDYSLEDISFSAEKGETIGIIGSTGCGKTTLVSLIPGFYPVASGEVLVDGKNVRDYDPDELKKKVGFCFQHYYMFKGTIYENVAFGKPGATFDEVKEALRIAQGLDFVMDKPGQLKEPVAEKGTNFSGGQKQRLMIARALVRKPEILVLDDSSSALDYATDRRLREAIKELKGMTVFIVSQRTASVLHADRIIVLEDGRVAGIGTHDELLKNNSVYREIYESCTKEQ
jgi:ABC-type multidrug transport system fused ATPase/permease subunit